MIPIKEIRQIEDALPYFGIDMLDLMEQAGKAIYDDIKARAKNKKIAVFCGSGNNGGDGFVAAYYLSKISDVTVLFLGKGSSFTNEARINFNRIKTNKIKIITAISQLEANYNILIDAMLGHGINGKLREPYRTAVKHFNRLKAYKVAVDMPTGYKAKCDKVIAFFDKKEGTKMKHVKVAKIGFPKNARNYVKESVIEKVTRKRKKTEHKGQNKRVLVIGGSKELVGAAALAGIAAFRTGVDLVLVAAPEKAAWAINALYPDIITFKLKGEYITKRNEKQLLMLIKKSDAVLIGNGIGQSDATKKFVKKIIKKINKPLVVDADAIKAININDIDNAILTPHQREFDIFLKNSRIKTPQQLIPKLKSNIILLKGHTDRIISKNKTQLNITGNVGMAKGGTGDILAGLCLGFYAQSGDAFNSAAAAAYLNGKIGDILEKRHKGYSYIASDMAEEITKMMAKPG